MVEAQLKHFLGRFNDGKSPIKLNKIEYIWNSVLELFVRSLLSLLIECLLQESNAVLLQV